jgi:hypothetical protein
MRVQADAGASRCGCKQMRVQADTSAGGCGTGGDGCGQLLFRIILRRGEGADQFGNAEHLVGDGLVKLDGLV